MTTLSRRDILKLSAFVAAEMGLGLSKGRAIASGLEQLVKKPGKVVWLQGMSCTGCSVSFLNADAPDIVQILTDVISLVFHPNVSAIQGEQALALLEKVRNEGDYLLVLEGSIPMAMPEACTLFGKNLSDFLPSFIEKAKGVVGAGTCASFGGIPAAEGNPTGAVSLVEFMRKKGIRPEGKLVNIPGCPSHPHSMVGSILHLLTLGYPEVDKEQFTPTAFFKTSVHDECPRFHYWEKHVFAKKFGEEGCLFELGCLGPLSKTDCPRRQWNSGTNWCVRAGAPCSACTSPTFAKMRDFPFYRKGEACHNVKYNESDRKGT